MAEYNGRPITRYGSPATNFNTPLSFDEELRFQKHKAKYSPRDSGEDYDERGAFLAGQVADQTKEEHGNDLWKKPNHPTQSHESLYAGHGPAGDWLPQGGYVPAGGLLKAKLKDDIAAADPRNKPTMRARNAWERDK
jgi:hypothetical protein